MKNLACSFTVNGTVKTVTLRKVPKERKFIVGVDGITLTYLLTEKNKIKSLKGNKLPVKELLPHIEWMICHYFINTKQLI
ncbi:hypothetical protein KTO58_22655 [Chitinophaga pendula]|uniref:hypothetical protein n=1 Tax=Chitinophaga TaxID=79328 RepID=UPI000BAFDF21|nr:MULTISPECIES: hypothetical protein [Chitinophaga]ASZ10582.1 hypothetical protein CK934_06125 [Chitinophaga sp. MD30]UCJ06443.1 hypothetical protein KTO58_22655 [Chitinophaga pendula]